MFKKGIEREITSAETTKNRKEGVTKGGRGGQFGERWSLGTFHYAITLDNLARRWRSAA